MLLQIKFCNVFDVPGWIVIVWVRAMEEKRDEILAERRAKLARLRGELSVQDRDITSAPSLTVVDEFQEEFSSADKRSGVIDKGEPQQQRNHTIFYAEQGARKESDLEFNKLVSEASRRGGKGAEQKGNDFGSGSTFAEDTDLDDELDGYSVSRSKSAGPVRSQTEGFPAGLSNQFEGGKSFNLGSSITKERFKYKKTSLEPGDKLQIGYKSIMRTYQCVSEWVDRGKMYKLPFYLKVEHIFAKC